MAADAQVQYAFTVNVLAELVAISDSVISFVFILGWHATEDSEMSLHVFAGQAKATLVRNMFLESIAKTFTEHPKAPMPKKRSHLNLTFHLEWCYKNRIRNILFHHQGLACLNDVEPVGQRRLGRPKHRWDSKLEMYWRYQRLGQWEDTAHDYEVWKQHLNGFVDFCSQ